MREASHEPTVDERNSEGTAARSSEGTAARSSEGPAERTVEGTAARSSEGTAERSSERTGPAVIGDAPTEAVTVASSASTDASLLGREVAGRYRILERLGAGGMGTVYRAEHLALAKPVAIKVIQPRFGDDPEIAQRFVKEARAASGLGHEHIVQVLDFGDMEGGGSFLVMEYLEGEDLAETLRREGPLAWERVAHIGEAIAWALAAAHAHGIVHRDIKPANCVRIARTGDPDFIKILDFGLAKVTLGEPDERSLTHTGMLLGTPGYIAPELYRGRRADHRVDLYALGALMYKLLTGELPAGKVDDPALVRSGAPAPLRALVERSLSDDPDQRHAAAGDLARELRAIPRVAGDAPTILAPLPTASQGSGERPTSDVSGGERSTPGVRESTPFSSLVVVERDGDKVRFSFGLPALALLIAAIAGVVWIAVRGPSEVPVPSDMAEKTEVVEVAAADEATTRATRKGRSGRDAGSSTSAAAGTAAAASAAEGTSTGSVEVAEAAGVAEVAEGTTTGTTGTSATGTTGEDPPTTAPALPVREGPPTGSPNALRRYLRSCGSSMTSAELRVRWRSDHEGRTIPTSVDVDVLDGAKSPTLIDCVRERTSENPFVWTANRPREVTVSFGGK